LARRRETGFPFLGKHLKPAARVEIRRRRQRGIADLENEKFSVRGKRRPGF